VFLRFVTPFVPGFTQPVVPTSLDTGLTYVYAGRAADWTSTFDSTFDTIQDKSAENNDLTLYSGRYFRTDGSNDKGINADCSTLGSGAYRLTGKVRSASTGTKYCNIGGSATFTVSAADVWEDFETSVVSGATPVNVSVGWDGGSNYSACDWSDVKLVNASSGDVLANWLGADHADATVDGLNALSCLDRVGDFHGTHDGCTGDTGEGIDEDFVGTVFEQNEDAMWFDGTDDYVSISTLSMSEFTLHAKIIWNGVNGFIVAGRSANVNDYIVLQNDGRLVMEFNVNNEAYLRTYATTFPVGSIVDIVIAVDIPNSEAKVYLNGEDREIQRVIGGADWGSTAFVFSRFGSYADNYSTGCMLSMEVFDNMVSTDEAAYLSSDGASGVEPTGKIHRWENPSWEDSIGDNDGTVIGNPVTIAQKRATIPQTAGMDWNKTVFINSEGDVFSDTFETSAGQFSYSNSTGSRVDNIGPAGDLRDNCVRLTPNGSDAVHYGRTAGGAIDYDKLLLATAEIYIPSSNTVVNEVRVDINEGNFSSANFLGGWVTTKGEWVEVSGTAFNASANGDSRVVLLTANSGDITFVGNGEHVYIRNIQVSEVSPNPMLIPESLTTAGVDALGSTILEPRVYDGQLNFFGDGEFAKALDSDSLDLTTEATWEFWGNFAAEPNAQYGIISKYIDADRAWFIYREALSTTRFRAAFGTAATSATFPTIGSVGGGDVLDQICCYHLTYNAGSLELYRDGVLVWTGATTATVLRNSGADCFVGGRFDNSDELKENAPVPIGSPKIYNRALTADEVLQNFNAQKSKYGL
jgi:hypothetical protein